MSELSEQKWGVIYTAELMELLLTNPRSKSQEARLLTLWNGLTESGRDYFEIWAEDKNGVLPKD